MRRPPTLARSWPQRRRASVLLLVAMASCHVLADLEELPGEAETSPPAEAADDADPIIGAWKWLSGSRGRLGCGPVYFHPSGVFDQGDCELFPCWLDGWSREADDIISIEQSNCSDETVQVALHEADTLLVLRWRVMSSPGGCGGSGGGGGTGGCSLEPVPEEVALRLLP